MRIHDVFHVLLLEPHHPNEIPGRQQPPPPPTEVAGEPYYAIREVMDSRWRAGKPEYLIDWEGYGPADRCWEPAMNLTPMAIDIFHKRFPDRPGPRPLLAPGRHRRGMVSRTSICKFPKLIFLEDLTCTSSRQSPSA